MGTNLMIWIRSMRIGWITAAIMCCVVSSPYSQPLNEQSTPETVPQTHAPKHSEGTPSGLVAPSVSNESIPVPGGEYRSEPPPTVKAAETKRIDHIMATATLGGTFNEAGISLANLVNTSRACKPLIGITPVATDGTWANMALLASGDVELAILQSYAAKTFPPTPKQTEFRAVTALWSNVDHFVIRSNLAETGTVEDFRNLYGRRVYIGAGKSGSAASTRALLTAIGVDPERLDTSFEGTYAQAAVRLIAGELDGASLPGGLPVSAVDQVLAALGDKIRLLSFSEDQFDRVQQATDGTWTRFTIEPDVYPGLSEPVQSMAQPVLLVANAAVEPYFVRCLLELIYGGQSNRQEVGLHPVLARLSLADAFPPTLPYPLHDGVCSFAAERGVGIPHSLRPPSGCAALIHETGADTGKQGGQTANGAGD